jgi:FkbM family methyltransferase
MTLSLLVKRAKKILSALTSPGQARALLRYRVLAGTEHREVLTSQIRSVVDVGANRGQFALAVRARLPEARIVSFEPLAGPAATFRAIFVGDELTQLHACAVGAQLERCKMYVAARDDSSSLLPVSEAQSANYPGTQTVALTEVEVVPLEHAVAPGSLPRPSMLKIDVQGSEYETLLGCETMLGGFDFVYCECSFVELYRGQRLAGEIVSWLFTRGFDLTGIYHLDRDRQRRPLQADLLFRRRSAGP